MSRRRSSNQLVVPQARQALDQFKAEAASTLGVPFQPDGYNGNLSTRDAGSIGGFITKRLVQIAEQQIGGRI
ncbi:small acid-soluble spore protein [Paenibacillus nanensis]|uniref:Small acid-soluble spore protein n=1 Tax=Paenibacillus nanensis TaxID=393251 RepID=A0A3A1UUS3_9BACL|nr:alpha/beta-type small acid-soluble spore protein [Paenibacillus nanensis]RIX50013.1 small acid-soluble spore protein [Paenibacillus nanensis]